MSRDKYFQDYSKYYWKWEDNREVATVGSITVAYTEQLKEIVSGLADQGLPPFGCILVILAATSMHDRDDYSNLRVVLSNVTQIESQHSLDRVFDLINTIGSMDNSYKKGKRRILLLQTLFRDSHNLINYRESSYIARVFAKKGLAELSVTEFRVSMAKLFSREMRILELINRKYPDVQSIKTAMANVPELESEILELESEEVNQSENELIDQLISNNSTTKVGLLIERIWSSANIPMHHRIPSGQPFGGVADITNKGSFDMLLTSEFANDDVTFLSRLANKEAMFFHREAPPSDNNQKRVILLDVSLKNWGTSRTVAFAMMLAIYHHPRSQYACNCYGIGTRVYDFKVDDIDGVIDAIQYLDTSLSSFKGLSSFLEEHNLDNSEVFLISNKESANLTKIKKLLSEYNHPIDYWIYPSKDGTVEISKKFRSGRKPHQSFTIPLESLWNRKIKPKVESQKPTSEPSQQTLEVPFGMLLPNPANYKHLLFYNSDVFKISKDGYLYRNVKSEVTYGSKGWELMHNGITNIHDQFAIGREINNGNWLLVSYNRIKHKFHVLDVIQKDEKHFDSPIPKSKESIILLCYEFSFFVRSDGKWYLLDLRGGCTEIRDVEKINGLAEVRQNQLESYKVLSRKYLHSDTIFKNFEKVCIDNSGQLTINKTRLHFNTQKRLVFKQLKTESRARIMAESTEEGTFEFPDGSKLIIHKGGVISLVSSSPKIPQIRIISMINVELAVVVDNKYAGHSKFYKPSYNLWKSKINGKTLFREEKNNLSLQSDSILISMYDQIEKRSMEEIYNTYIYKYLSHIMHHGR